MIIGICGKSGSGKTTLANQIKKYTDGEVAHLEIDKVGHKVNLLPEVKKELIEAFGGKILMGEEIDRKKLSKIVFGSKNEMDKLAEITWKYMDAEIEKFIRENKDKTIILDWLLLTVTRYFAMCDIKILLDVPYEERLNRTIERDNITKEAFDLREKASIDYNFEEFDYVLSSNDEETVRRILKK